MAGKIKRWILARTIRKALTWGVEQLDMDKIPDLLKSKTVWSALIGLVATILAGMGQGEVADSLQQGADAVQGGLTETIKWVAAFASMIFLRLGVMKSK